MRTHYEHGPHGTACGRAASRTTTNTYAVDCRACGKTPAFIAAQETAAAVKMERFLAQEPVVTREPWREGNIKCSECGHDKFREADRTCYGHYSNHVCGRCGHTESRLTETGRSF